MEGYMELIDTLPPFTGADFDRLSRLSNNAEGPSPSVVKKKLKNRVQLEYTRFLSSIISTRV